MFIKSLSYINHHEGWEIEKTEFTEFNLLVGASGVGKTQILRAISSLKFILMGISFNGVKWEIEFNDNSGNYAIMWKGGFISEGRNQLLKNGYFPDKDSTPYPIESESIEINGETLISRNKSITQFKKVPYGKLNKNKSAIYLMNEEDELRPIISALQLLMTEKLGITNNIPPYYPLFLEPLKNDIELINSVYPAPMKIVNCFIHHQSLFSQIKERYKNIFPQVEDIRLHRLENDADRYQFQIKEYDSDRWIRQEHISSGMLSTFNHLCTIYLSAPGSVILIDEIENSLGVNCLPDIIEDMKDADRNLQFIVTSHHPYVINNIPVSDWKIVTRRNGKISVHPAEEFDIGHSRHESFTQLINLPQYRTGNYDGHSNAR